MVTFATIVHITHVTVVVFVSSLQKVRIEGRVQSIVTIIGLYSGEPGCGARWVRRASFDHESDQESDQESEKAPGQPGVLINANKLINSTGC